MSVQRTTIPALRSLVEAAFADNHLSEAEAKSILKGVDNGLNVARVQVLDDVYRRIEPQPKPSGRTPQKRSVPRDSGVREMLDEFIAVRGLPIGEHRSSIASEIKVDLARRDFEIYRKPQGLKNWLLVELGIKRDGEPLIALVDPLHGEYVVRKLDDTDSVKHSGPFSIALRYRSTDLRALELPISGLQHVQKSGDGATIWRALEKCEQRLGVGHKAAEVIADARSRIRAIGLTEEDREMAGAIANEVIREALAEVLEILGGGRDHSAAARTQRAPHAARRS